MASWADFERARPELAAAARERLDAHRHKTMATLRRDGSPRISGIEATFLDGELWLGMMGGSLKARDLLRDPRLALHSASVDPPAEDPTAWAGDAKLSGRAVEVDDAAFFARLVAATSAGDHDAEPPAAGDSHLFRIELEEAVVIRVDGEELLIERWSANDPEVKRIRRK